MQQLIPFSFLQVPNAYLSPKFTNMKYMKYFLHLIQYDPRFISYLKKKKKEKKKKNIKRQLINKIKKFFKGRIARLFHICKLDDLKLRLKTRKYLLKLFSRFQPVIRFRRIKKISLRNLYLVKSSILRYFFKLWRR